MTRVARTSITQLVKDVSAEVCVTRKEFEELKQQLKNKPQVDRKGYSWSDFEDMSLKDSYTAFVHMMAQIHGRTTNAIHSRLRQHIGGYSDL